MFCGVQGLRASTTENFRALSWEAVRGDVGYMAVLSWRGDSLSLSRGWFWVPPAPGGGCGQGGPQPTSSPEVPGAPPWAGRSLSHRPYRYYTNNLADLT